ncbi:putative olfactory receptor 2B8 [Spea bombifrons]|uniref:putative olfactory receptor 2B8 n=1 Tax=Spea bombifrons TaxID=233779 RepID=UPI002349AEA1|nr:putative olfactory receptor 2B8 [Spea bombifrons]
MAWGNGTVATEFILLGLSSDPTMQIILFVVFLVVYMMILLGNSLIIMVTATDSSLHTPMYFFITNLSILDICYSTTGAPRMLKDSLSVKKTISYAECVAQMYIGLSLGENECMLLAVMAYDRYIAICHPLHYTVIISKSVFIKAAAGTWICGFLLSIPDIVLICSVGFCGPNKINHAVCEVPEVLALGCGNTAIVEFVIFAIGVIVLMIPITFIILSYVRIILAILKITSSAGRLKVFSTCGSHILVVTLFYGSAMAAYLKPKSKSSANVDKILSVFYGTVTSMLNPLIYTLRNEQVKTALKKMKIRKLLSIHL